jgi:hypothetical protein
MATNIQNILKLITVYSSLSYVKEEETNTRQILEYKVYMEHQLNSIWHTKPSPAGIRSTRQRHTKPSPAAYEAHASAQRHTKPSPAAYKALADLASGIRSPRQRHTKPSPAAYEALASGIRSPRQRHTKPSPAAYKALASWHTKPSPAAYEALASGIRSPRQRHRTRHLGGRRSIHQPSQAAAWGPEAKKTKTGISKSRQAWVEGCSAAMPRRDTFRQSTGFKRPSRGGRGRGRGKPDNRSKGWPKGTDCGYLRGRGGWRR